MEYELKVIFNHGGHNIIVTLNDPSSPIDTLSLLMMPDGSLLCVLIPREHLRTDEVVEYLSLNIKSIVEGIPASIVPTIRL